MLIIAFGHRSGVGKDTCAKFLNTHLRCRIRGKTIKVASFAAKLKQITYELYGWAGVKPAIHYENCRKDRDIVLPELGMTVVDLWVKVGEALREVYGETWVRCILEGTHADILIIPDLRHPNEFDRVLGKNGLCYKVVNSRIADRIGISIDDYLKDESRWKSIISNEGDLKNLSSQMEQLAIQLIEEYNLNDSD